MTKRRIPYLDQIALTAGQTGETTLPSVTFTPFSEDIVQVNIRFYISACNARDIKDLSPKEIMALNEKFRDLKMDEAAYEDEMSASIEKNDDGMSLLKLSLLITSKPPDGSIGVE